MLWIESCSKFLLSSSQQKNGIFGLINCWNHEIWSVYRPHVHRCGSCGYTRLTTCMKVYSMVPHSKLHLPQDYVTYLLSREMPQCETSENDLCSASDDFTCASFFRSFLREVQNAVKAWPCFSVLLCEPADRVQWILATHCNGEYFTNTLSHLCLLCEIPNESRIKESDCWLNIRRIICWSRAPSA